MKYVSTRDKRRSATGAQAIVAGIAPDGGLYAPPEFPVCGEEALLQLAPLSYAERAAKVLTYWLDDFSAQALESMCREAYARFGDPAVAPVKKLPNDKYMLELWHGPTLAFKDMALQLLPRLMTAASRAVGEERDILILVATSGDTGKAALEGFAGVPGVKICVFYPEGGVSEAQRLQMVTQTGANTRVVAVRGNFDDAQTGVKRIFTSPECIEQLNARGTVLSSANSINLGRLVPQVAYYVSGWLEMIAQGAVRPGEQINVCVPTGNFGNILAALYAKKLGVPVNKLICASNENNVLTDFINRGVYDRKRPFHLTTSPSMDIVISSNLERLLFELSGRDDARVRAFMDDLKQKGEYRLNAEELAFLHTFMWGGYAPEDEVAREIRRSFEQDGYLLDPHTAVATAVAEKYRRETGDRRPMLTVSTASPYKFGRAVLGAIENAEIAQDDFECCRLLARKAGQTVPESIASLPAKPVLHDTVCDKDAMWQALLPIVTGA